MAKDYADTLFDAISVLVNKKVNAMHFDETKKALIINADEAEKGIYTVTEDQVYSYLAYSTVTDYKINDTVLVTIPQGNYDNQKIIVGKSVVDTGSPIIYTSPFATIIDISNNIITRDLGYVELYANGSSYVWPLGITNFPKEYDNSSENTRINNLLDEDADQWDAYKMQCVWQSASGLNLSGYTRIGLQAQIATYLGEYNTILGNYGLALEVTYKCLELTEGQNTFSNCIVFDSDEYFGNVYRFDTYYTQEAVYDISDYLEYPIDQLRLFVYQRHNFIDKNGDDVPAPDEDDFSNISPNIIFKDFYICVGEEIDKFKNDTAKLISNNSQEYYKNVSNVQSQLSIEDITTSEIFTNFQVSYGALISSFWSIPNISNYIEYTGEGSIAENVTPYFRPAGMSGIKKSFESNLQLYNLLQNIAFKNIPTNDISGAQFINSNFQGGGWHFITASDPRIPDEVREMVRQLYSLNNDFTTLFDLVEENSLKEYSPYTVSLRAQENLKEIELIWLHKEATSGIIRKVETNDLPRNYHVWWYRYRLGARSPDLFAGPMWERFYGCRDEASEDLEYGITQEEYDEDNSRDIATDRTFINFIPNVNRSKEQIKAIIVYDEDDNTQRFIVASDPIEFLNRDEVRNEATIIDLNTLAIRAEDDQCGKYFIYNRAGELEANDANLTRTLVALFDTEPVLQHKAILSQYESIEWIFPTENTMLVPAVSANSGAAESSSNIITGTNRVGYYIKKHLDRAAMNNTVQLRVLRDGQWWSADITLLFGTAGSSGSDYTVVLTWENQVDRALDVTHPGWSSLIGEVGLYDNIAGCFIDFPTDSEIEYSWAASDIKPVYVETSDTTVKRNKDYFIYNSSIHTYDRVTNPDGNPRTQGYYESKTYGFVYENRDLYYPIFSNANQLTFEVDYSDDNSVLKDSASSRISDTDTYGGYYYYLDNNYVDVLSELNSFISGGSITYSNNQFQYESNEVGIEDNVVELDIAGNESNSTLAYFDMQEKKYKLIKMGNTLSINEGKLIVDGYVIDQIYRKRKNNLQHQFTTVNKNEDFFKDIYDTFFNASVDNEESDIVNVYEQQLCAENINNLSGSFKNNINISEKGLNKYCYYNNKHFSAIFQSNNITFSTLVNLLETYIFSESVIYKLNDILDIGSTYEFNKPEIEFLPLVISQSTYDLDSGALGEEVQDQLDTFNFNYSNAQEDKQKFKQSLQNFLYLDSPTTSNQLQTALSNIKENSDIFGWMDTNPPNLGSYALYWPSNDAGSYDDIFCIYKFYSILRENYSASSLETINNFMWNTFIKNQSAASLDWYFSDSNNNISNSLQVISPSLASGTHEYIALDQGFSDSIAMFSYTDIYELLTEANNNYATLKASYNNSIKPYLDSLFYRQVDNAGSSLANLLYKHFMGSINSGLNLQTLKTNWFGNSSSLKLKPIQDLSSDNGTWFYQVNTQSIPMTQYIRESGDWSSIYQNRETNNKFKLSRYLSTDDLNDFNNNFKIYLTTSNTHLFSINNVDLVQNIVKQKILQNDLSLVSIEDQYNFYSDKNLGALGGRYNNSNIIGANDLYESSTGIYTSLSTLFTTYCINYNTVAQAFTGLNTIQDILNRTSCCTLSGTSSTECYRTIYSTLFDTSSITIQEIIDYILNLQNNQQMLRIQEYGNTTTYHVYSLTSSVSIFQLFYSTDFDSSYVFYNNSAINQLGNVLDNSNVFWIGDDVPSTLTSYIRISNCRIIMTDNDNNSADIYNICTARTTIQGLNKKYKQIIAQFTYDTFAKVNDSWERTNQNQNQDIIVYADSSGGTTVTNWLRDNYTSFFVNNFSSHPNILIFSSINDVNNKIFNSLYKYSNSALGDSFPFSDNNWLSKYYLALICLNDFYGKTFSANLSNSRLLISETGGEYINLLSNFNNLDTPIGKSSAAQYLLDNFYYKNSTFQEDASNTNHTLYQNIINRQDNIYFGVTVWNDKRQFAKLYYLVYNTDNITTTQLFNVVFNNQQLFEQYFQFDKDEYMEYYDVDNINYNDTNLSQYIRSTSAGNQSIASYLISNITNYINKSDSLFGSNAAGTAAKIQYINEQLYSLFHTFYNNLLTTVKIQRNYNYSTDKSNLLQELIEFILPEGVSLGGQTIEQYLNPMVSVMPKLINFSSTTSIVDDLGKCVFVDSDEKKLYNILYKINNIDSESSLYNILNETKVVWKLLQEENTADIKGYLFDYYFTGSTSIVNNIFEALINKLRDIQNFKLQDENESESENQSVSQVDNYYISLNNSWQSVKAYLASAISYLGISFNDLYSKCNNLLNNFQIYEKTDLNQGLLSNQMKVFNYYNKYNQRAFINVDGYYIIDPYDTWVDGETYYEPIQVQSKNCQIQPLRYVASSSRENNYPNNKVMIYPASGLTTNQLMNSLSILQITIKNFGDYELITREPIPLRNGTVTASETGQVLSEYRYIDGATYVRYTSGGTVDYENAPYNIYQRRFVNNNTTLNQVESDASSWNIFMPSLDALQYNDNNNFIPTISSAKILQPSPVYIPNLGVYGVQYKDSEDNIYWTQPINVFEDNYPSSTLNKWNGTDIITDNDTGTIVASAISAGKKERDNTFTGLMLGDWSRSDTDSFISKQTGLYGFYHGSMSYAFTDDGRGFIGRDGRGRIYFDGMSSTIYSSNWKGNNSLGMFLDVDDGIIKLQSQDRENLDVMHYITLSSQEFKYPLSIGNQKHTSLRDFKVDWEGKAELQNATVQGVIHAESGTLGDLLVKGTLTGGVLSGSVLEVQQGQIGGWIISSGGLVNPAGTTRLSSAASGGIVTDSLAIQTSVINWGQAQYDANTRSYIIDESDYQTQELGRIGYFIGAGDNGPTNLIGIRSTAADGISIETPSNIRLSGIGSGTKADGIFIYANKIQFKVEANNQEGIYARFA